MNVQREQYIDTVLKKLHLASKYYLNSNPSMFNSYSQEIEFLNNAADFWRYGAGVNVIPASTRIKKVTIAWREFQCKAISESQHQQWKEEGAFKNGIAIIPGKVWHRPDKLGKFLTVLDFDKDYALKEFCSLFGSNTSLEDLAKEVLLEQHADNKEKGHCYFYSPIPLINKGPDSTLGLEVKGLGSHGIIFCFPSIHKNYDSTDTSVHRYKIIGVLREPPEFTIDQSLKIIRHIDDLCKGNDLEYLDKYSKFDSLRPMIKNLTLEYSVRIEEGERHTTLLRAADSLLVHHLDTGKMKSEAELRKFLDLINDNLCDPNPLPTKELDSIWKSALKWYQKRAIKPIFDAKTRNSKGFDLIEVVNDSILGIISDRGEQYAAIKVKDHIQTISINSNKFKDWVITTCYLYSKSQPHDAFSNRPKLLSNEEASKIQAVIRIEAADKMYSKELDIRVAGYIGKASEFNHQGNVIYYDLTNNMWDIVEVTEDEWRIIKHGTNSAGNTFSESQIHFKRYNNQLPQVIPSRNYSSDILDQFLDLLCIPHSDTTKRLLVKVYLISIFLPKVPKTILCLDGVQGSAKTTFQEMIKSLVDPCGACTLSFPKSSEDLIQQLAHNYVAYYDNLSDMPSWISDAFCRAVTGSGSSKRVLYSNDDDFVYQFRRCVGFNGINLAAAKPDLLDRCLIFHQPQISGRQRRLLRQSWQDFDGMKPQLLGYIFDVLVKVLNKIHDVTIDELPRMADWAEAGEAISQSLGYRPNEFIDAYKLNMADQNTHAIESSQVAQALIQFTENNVLVDDSYGHDLCYFEGSMTELLMRLTEIANKNLKINTSNKIMWPQSSQSLGHKLNEILANLNRIGIKIERPQNKANHSRDIKLIKLYQKIDGKPEISSPLASPSSNAKICAQNEWNTGNGKLGEHTLNNNEKEYNITNNKSHISEKVDKDCTVIPEKFPCSPFPDYDQDYAQNHDNTDGKHCRKATLEAHTANGKSTVSNSAETYQNSSTDLITSIDSFFLNDPDAPYQPPRPHSLEQSPCRDIIGKDDEFYYCKLHPNIQYIHLDTMEHHIKYKEPVMHKNAITSICSGHRT